MESVTAAEMSVDLTRRDCVTTVGADPDLVHYVVCREIYLEMLSHSHLDLKSLCMLEGLGII
jgi:hypothetical protein